jgi:hypothetical protein
MQIVDYGQIAFIFMQIVVFVASAVVYSRQLNAVDLEKRDRGAFGSQVAEALRVATLALRGVDLMEVEHYKALASKHAVLLQEVESLKVRIAAFEETVQSLSNKLASRERADAAAIRRASAVQTREPNSQEPSSLDELVNAGIAVPLKAASQQNPVNSVPFGKTVRGA